MCGRFTLYTDEASLARHFALVDSCRLKPGWNITPASDIPIVYIRNRGRVLINAHWGLVPHWAKDDTFQPINARAETVATKPFFRDAYKNGRCLIPASGFYEWQGSEGHKQPYYFSLPDTDIFAFAGLRDHWDSPGKSLDSCTIITTAANDIMAPVHNRMPVILAPDDYDAWLNGDDGDLLQPYAGEMQVWPVSTLVNNPKHDGRDLIKQLQ